MSRKSLAWLAAGILLAAGALYGTAWYQARALIRQQLQQLVDSGRYQKADYGSLWLSPLGALHVGELELQQPDFALVLEKVELTDVDLFHLPPRRMTLTVHNLRFPQGVPDLAPVSPLLADLLARITDGNTLRVTLGYRYYADPQDASHLYFSSNAMLPDLFELDASTETRNWPLDDMAAAQAAIPPEAALPQAAVRLHDLGIVDTFVEAMADSSQASVGDTRAVLRTQLQGAWMLMPPQLQNLARQAGGELGKFIDGGRTLTLAVTPQQGGKLQELQLELMGAALTSDYDKVADLLQLRIDTL